jgi:hypothetical protein
VRNLVEWKVFEVPEIRGILVTNSVLYLPHEL